MAWVSDVSNCTEGPEPTSSVGGAGSHSARLATRNHDMRGAERLHRKQERPPATSWPRCWYPRSKSSYRLSAPAALDRRTKGAWCGTRTPDRACLQRYEHGRCVGRAEFSWMISNISLIGSTARLPIDGAVRAVLLHLD